MTTERLDVEALLAEAPSRQANGAAAVGSRGDLSEASRTRLSELRGRLLALHKSLLDDAQAAYEMDRGRVSSPGNLLQLVINDPWFAWLHPLSELVVRIDEAAGPDSALTEGDAKALLEHVDRLLLPSETGDTFARRYFEALQRQPAVVLAHGAVKRVLKSG